MSASMPMRVLVLIPARGGSKGLVGKNLRLCAGRPLLVWSIRAAREFAASASGVDARIYVSTDDEQIADVAQRNITSVIMRPAELATNTATTDAVIAHAVSLLDRSSWAPDLVVLLQPTVPVRERGLVDRCVSRLLDTGADSLLTAYPLHFVWWREHASYHYEKDSGAPTPTVWRSQCGHAMRPRRQDMTAREIMFHEDGSVYVSRADLVRATGARLGGRIEVFETTRSIDIDTEEDLRTAEALIEARGLVERIEARA